MGRDVRRIGELVPMEVEDGDDFVIEDTEEGALITLMKDGKDWIRITLSADQAVIAAAHLLLCAIVVFKRRGIAAEQTGQRFQAVLDRFFAKRGRA